MDYLYLNMTSTLCKAWIGRRMQNALSKYIDLVAVVVRKERGLQSVPTLSVADIAAVVPQRVLTRRQLDHLDVDLASTVV